MVRLALASTIHAWLLGCPWLLLGLGKLIGPDGFLAYVGDALNVGLGLGQVLGWAVIVGEIFLGAALLCFSRPPASLMFTAASLLLGLTALAHAALADGGHACGCFGSLAEATSGRRMVVSAAIVLLAASQLTEILRVRANAADPGAQS